MVALLILTCAINDEEEGEEEEDEEEIDDEFKEDESVIEKINICSLELVVNKAIGLVNKSPKWSEKFDKVANFEDVKVVQHGSLPRSLPLINDYQYYWRTKATENVTNQKIVISNKVCVSGNMNINQASNDVPRQLFILRGRNGDYLVHNLKC